MFLSPLLLAGLGAVTIPLVIHFLSRSRFRSVDFGAMLFLSPSSSSHPSTGRFRQFLLLLLRSLILATLAIALARPVVAGHFGQSSPSSHRLLILILDISPSTSAQDAGRSRLDLAKDACLKLLSRLHPQDQVSLILAGSPTPLTDSRPTSDLSSIASRISSLTSGPNPADIASSLTSAMDLVDRTASLDHDIAILCDRQARSWDTVTDAFIASFQSRLSSVRRNTKLYLFPAGGSSSENVSIESLTLINPPLIRGQPIDLELRVHNLGRQPQTNLPLTISTANQSLFSTTVNLDPGTIESVHATLRLPAAGPQTLTASLDSPDPDFDNTLEASLTVFDSLNILILSGDQRPASPLHSEADFIQLALSPFPKNSPNPNLATTTIAPSLPPDLTPFTTIILANLPDLPDPDITRLEQFVYAGHGLLLAPGSLTQIDRFNQTLYRNGAGLSPARLSLPTPPDSPSTSLLGLSLDHPILHFLKGTPSPVPPATFSRYFPSSPRPGDSHILATFATGDPAFIEGSFGKGHVLLSASPLDADWSNLPLTSFYLPFIQSAARYLSDSHVSASTITRPNLSESDLTPLTDDTLDRLRKSLSFEDLSDPATAPASFLGETRSELWLPLIICCIGMLLVESTLSQRFSR